MLSLTLDTTGLEIKAKFFRGFGDPSRLKILELLREAPHTVSQIIEQTHLAQSNVSNHLGCLRTCGLVIAEKQGRYVIYRLSDDRVAELLDLAVSLLADAARGVYECTRYNLLLEGSEE